MPNTREVVEEGAAAHQAGGAGEAAAGGDARAADAAGAGKLLVIVPAYNEAGHVGAVIADVLGELPHADVLVVDDGSEDATADEAQAAGATVVRLPVNCGYGTALQTGYKYAARHAYAFVGQIDADGQHRAEYLAQMLETVRDGRADLVVGSRFLARDGHYDTPLARAIGIRLFGRLATFATGQTVTDPTSGFQVMRAEIARLFARDIFPVDYPDADVLILLHRTGYRVRELAVQMRPSPGGSMHTRNSTPYYVYKMLLSILVTVLRPRGRRPR